MTDEETGGDSPHEDLPKALRLRGKESVSRLFQDGARGSSGNVLARVLANGSSQSRLAAVAGRKLGNAVVRNRMRRRLRAAFRTQKAHMPAGWDIALVARAGVAESTWQDLRRDVVAATRRAVRAASESDRPGRRH